MPARTSLTAAATTLLLLCTTSAYAVDAQAFADRLKDVAQQQDLALNFASAEANGNNVVLKGLTMGPASSPAGKKSDPHDVTFENVTGSTPDGWTVARVPVPDFEQSGGPTSTAIKGMTIEGLKIAGTKPAETSQALKIAGVLFDHASVDSIDVQRDGKPVFSLSNASIDNTVAEDKTLTSDFDFGKFSADLTAGRPTPSTDTLKELGYTNVSGTMGGTATWDPASGLLQLDPFDIDVNDVGDLSFTYAISGYTPSFIASLRQLQEQMSKNADSQQATGMAMMGLISQLYLKSADLTFVDDSLTNKLLDFYAKRNNQTREQLVDQLTSVVPAALNYLQNPEFEKQVQDAVTSYLKDPQSISLTIAPDQPVPATQVIGAAMGAPQTLPSVLQLSVSSNDVDNEGGNDDDDTNTPAPDATNAN